MNRFIHKEEWYPVYELHATMQYASIQQAPPTEISDKLMAEYQAAVKEFNRVQRKLSRLYDKQHAQTTETNWRDRFSAKESS